MGTDTDQQIVDLCIKVIAMQDSSEFQAAVEELRVALHRRISAVRDSVAEARAS